jgi:protein-S-isoprenylcysteine O-methyltransferase Ste14
MLFVRAIVFTILAPGVLTVYIPWLIRTGITPANGGARFFGVPLIAAGALCYFACAFEFLLRGRGTPALFITKPLRFLIGEEPKLLIQSALYRHTRNPMYLSVVTVVLGESLLFESRPVLLYALFLWLMFHLTVVLIEEPHLRDRPGYRAYCARVPRWLFF